MFGPLERRTFVIHDTMFGTSNITSCLGPVELCFRYVTMPRVEYCKLTDGVGNLGLKNVVSFDDVTKGSMHLVGQGPIKVKSKHSKAYYREQPHSAYTHVLGGEHDHKCLESARHSHTPPLYTAIDGDRATHKDTAPIHTTTNRDLAPSAVDKRHAPPEANTEIWRLTSLITALCCRAPSPREQSRHKRRPAA